MRFALRVCIVCACIVAAIPAVAFGQGRQANPNPPPNPPNPADLAREVERFYVQNAEWESGGDRCDERSSGHRRAVFSRRHDDRHTGAR